MIDHLTHRFIHEKKPGRWEICRTCRGDGAVRSTVLEHDNPYTSGICEQLCPACKGFGRVQFRKDGGRDD